MLIYHEELSVDTYRGAASCANWRCS